MSPTQTSSRCACVVRSFVIAIALFFAAAAHAAISVSGGGTGILTFDALPAVTEWSTLNITGAGNTIQSVAAMDTSVQTRTAAGIATVLGSSGTVPPSGNAIARWNSAQFYLQTLPTGNAATLLMATLQNDIGADAIDFTVTYDMGVNNPTALELPGWQVYYSLTGAADSWQKIPALSDVNTAGTLTTTVTLPAAWPSGSLLYLLWADDNADTATDESYTLDNFSLTATPGTTGPITITNQPQSITVAERGTATFTVGADGSPRNYYWFRDGVQIPGNNQSTYTIPSVVYPTDNNAQIYVVISNSLSFVTSSTAVLTVTPDTTAPTVVSAVGNLDPTIVTVNFSEAVDINTVSEGTATVFISGTNPDDGLLTAGYFLTNNNRTIVFTTDPREYGSNYSIRITGVLDASSQQNPMVPDPTIIPLPQTIQLIGFDTNNEWKWDLNNGDRFGTGWETIGFDDSTWPSGPAGLGLDASVNGVPILTAMPYLADSSPAYFRRHFFLPTGTNGVTRKPAPMLAHTLTRSVTR